MRALLLLAACLSGCVSTPPAARPDPASSRDAPAQVVVSAHLPPPLSIYGLVVTLDDGVRRWTVAGRDLEHASGHVWRGEPYSTATTGTLHVAFELRSAEGVAAQGQVTLALRPDWIHGVDIHAATVGPRRSCMGCQGWLRFPLAPASTSATADAIYVVWGGNSISSPVVY